MSWMQAHLLRADLSCMLQRILKITWPSVTGPAIPTRLVASVHAVVGLHRIVVRPVGSVWEAALYCDSDVASAKLPSLMCKLSCQCKRGNRLPHIQGSFNWAQWAPWAYP